MDVIVVCVGAGVCLALWAVLHRKVAEVPRTVWEIVRQERAAEAARAQTLVQEAAAVRVGAIVRSLREHEEQGAASLRAQIAEAENRARVTERRASDAGVALSAVSELVRESRALRDELRSLVATARAPAAPGAASEERAERETVEQRRPAPETTRMPGGAAPASRERRSPRGTAEGLTPPGSAEVLPSGPAMKAAGLGPRPSSRPVPKATLLGIRPPLTPPSLRAPDAEEEDRESSEELTTVGVRPPASALSPLAATLPSMAAVTPPSAGKGGGS
jgi:hypothetical protein